jgi:hypothetical protein
VGLYRLGITSPRQKHAAVPTGRKEMLKMKVDPDESLKIKGKLRSEIIDPDGCLKTNEL